MGGRGLVVAAVVLAAGGGRRFGRPKAGVVVAGERLVDRAVRVAREGGCEPVVAVLGAELLEVPGAVVAENPEWAEGLGSSLRAGLAALAGTDAGAAVVLLADQPFVEAEAVRRLVAAAAGPGALAAATYAGERGHPVLIGREHWAGVAALAHGDAGARPYLRGREVTGVECPGSPFDVDRPSDLPG